VTITHGDAVWHVTDKACKLPAIGSILLPMHAMDVARNNGPSPSIFSQAVDSLSLATQLEAECMLDAHFLLLQQSVGEYLSSVWNLTAAGTLPEHNNPQAAEAQSDWVSVGALNAMLPEAVHLLRDIELKLADMEVRSPDHGPPASPPTPLGRRK
jgi:hypothetical protein